MPAPTSAPLRQQLWLRAQQGQSAAEIARALGLPTRTTRRLLACFRQAQGPTQPCYRRCGRPLSPLFCELRQQVLALRRLHPSWGAGRILVQLRGLDPRGNLPDPATLRRWLARAGLAPRRKHRAAPAAPRACRPHQVWQMDAKEAVCLRGGRRVCWLRLVDEATGAVLFSLVFDKPRWAEVGAAAVQAALRQAFARWGRPEALRVDNGCPWVSPEASLPSELELWLAGLGVALWRNPKRRPQANGKVERSQRTAGDWAEPGQCDTPEQLQRRLDEEDRVQRESYPRADGHSRLEADLDLLHSGRVYAAGYWEAVCWDLGGAYCCLAGYVACRKVDKDGNVYLYDHRHRVGAAYRGQLVQVRFQSDGQQWLFTQDGGEVGRSEACEISQERICALRVSRRSGRSARETQARRARRGGRAQGGPAGLAGAAGASGCCLGDAQPPG